MTWSARATISCLSGIVADRGRPERLQDCRPDRLSACTTAVVWTTFQIYAEADDLEGRCTSPAFGYRVQRIEQFFDDLGDRPNDGELA